jgi:hypothetical protein
LGRIFFTNSSVDGPLFREQEFTFASLHINARRKSWLTREIPMQQTRELSLHPEYHGNEAVIDGQSRWSEAESCNDTFLGLH